MPGFRSLGEGSPIWSGNGFGTRSRLAHPSVRDAASTSNQQEPTPQDAAVVAHRHVGHRHLTPVSQSAPDISSGSRPHEHFAGHPALAPTPAARSGGNGPLHTSTELTANSRIPSTSSTVLLDVLMPLTKGTSADVERCCSLEVKGVMRLSV